MKISARKDAKANGETRYFTGSPCKYGHTSERWTVNAKCVACHELTLIRMPATTAEEKKEKARERARRWYESNKQKTIDRASAWKRGNPGSIAASERRRRAKPHGKAICFMRDSLRRVLRIEKNGRTEAILEYSRQELISHLEGLFLPGMTWENHGDWHIDHIHPISAYLSEGVTDPAVINALSNLQPLWAADNLSKGAKVQ